MRTALSTLAVERPRDLAHALRLMHRSLADGRLVPLAGGTDLLVQLHGGAHAGARFLDLSPLAELRTIRSGKGGLRVGALATFDAIARHRAAAAWPMLVSAARVVGAAQIQNRATLGGNIANASPAGDSLPVLLAYDAVVRVASVRGERAIAFEDFHTGYREVALAPDELIVAIELPPRPAGACEMFRKVGTRAAQSISKVVFAGSLVVRRGRAAHVRLAWGSVAPTPVRARGAEAALETAPAGSAAARAAAAALGSELSPIDDIRSDAGYRAAVAQALFAQFLRSAHASFRSR